MTLAALALAVTVLAAFVLTETRAAQPITPLRLFADGQRFGVLRGPAAAGGRHVRDVLLRSPSTCS